MTDAPPQPDLIEVRATINLSRLPAGAVATVDRADPEIAYLIDNDLLVPVEDDA